MAQRKAAPLVGVVMGSESDWEVMRHAVAQLDAFGVPNEPRRTGCPTTCSNTRKMPRPAGCA